MPEELRCRQFLWYRSTVNGNERLVATPAQLVYALCHELLSRTACTIDEHGHWCGSHKSHIVIQLACRLAFTLHIFYCIGLGRTLCQCLPALRGSGFTSLLYGLLNLLQEILGVQWLRYIVAGTALHGIHGSLYIGITGHYYHRDRILPCPFKQGCTVTIGQSKVGEHKLHTTLLKFPACTAYTACLQYIEPLPCQPCLEHGREGYIILYNQYCL